MNALLNSVYRITKRINEKVRDTLILICCLLLMGSFFFSHLKVTRNTGDTMVYGSAVLGIMTILSINNELKPIKWNKYKFYPMVLFGLGALLIGLMHPVGDGYVMLAVDLSLLFPVFYYVWLNREDHETLYKMISLVIMACSLASFILCIYLALKGKLIIVDGRVCGHTSNPNLLGMLGVITVIAGTFLMMEFCDRIWILIVCSLCLGIGISYTIISVSRSAMLAVLTDIFISVLFAVKVWRKSKSLSLKWTRIVVSCILIGGIVVIGASLDNTNKKHQEENIEATTIEESTDAISEETSAVSKRWDTGSVDNNINTYSSGRVDIWKLYAHNFSWFGKDIKTIEPELERLSATRAHNNIIDYLFRYGYIVGSLYIVFYIAVGISGLTVLFSKKYREPSDCFLVMVIGTYSIYALIEISTLPFCRCIPCLFFLSIAPIMGEGRLPDEQQ